MAKVRITVCDVCQSKDRPTSHYAITTDQVRASLDLCAEHSAPIDALLLEHAAERPAILSLSQKVSTIEEIEKLKREGKDKPKP